MVVANQIGATVGVFNAFITFVVGGLAFFAVLAVDIGLAFDFACIFPAEIILGALIICGAFDACGCIGLVGI